MIVDLSLDLLVRTRKPTSLAPHPVSMPWMMVRKMFVRSAPCYTEYNQDGIL